jgi:hypothetical protein
LAFQEPKPWWSEGLAGLLVRPKDEQNGTDPAAALSNAVLIQTSKAVSNQRGAVTRVRPSRAVATIELLEQLAAQRSAAMVEIQAIDAAKLLEALGDRRLSVLADADDF